MIDPLSTLNVDVSEWQVLMRHSLSVIWRQPPAEDCVGGRRGEGRGEGKGKGKLTANCQLANWTATARPIRLGVEPPYP